MNYKKTVIDVCIREDAVAPVFENLPAFDLGNHTYELLASPGLALNLAKGDIIDITEPGKPAVVVRRGGNFCIQIYADDISYDDIDALDRALSTQLHGSVDGRFGGSIAISIPASAGMDKVAELLDPFTARTGHPWYFCNIYKNVENLEDETLLDWWR
ncbi:DUF4265 domain-containing protein [Massilia aquatica]|uniref:DUF4265 domain-containing protein n=1 Tax=Massilia aquatica TaxID=2609000 RepID=A0ABX0MBF0_9BURK|nr:DUF4265 domain-containing protein [Massilia aquatica]NHZ44510.1 DUF4265 domain-containing protein [Massilia aquatica]